MLKEKETTSVALDFYSFSRAWRKKDIENGEMACDDAFIEIVKEYTEEKGIVIPEDLYSFYLFSEEWHEKFNSKEIIPIHIAIDITTKNYKRYISSEMNDSSKPSVECMHDFFNTLSLDQEIEDTGITVFGKAYLADILKNNKETSVGAPILYDELPNGDFIESNPSSLETLSPGAELYFSLNERTTKLSLDLENINKDTPDGITEMKKIITDFKSDIDEASEKAHLKMKLIVAATTNLPDEKEMKDFTQRFYPKIS